MFRIETDYLGALVRFKLVNMMNQESVSVIPGFGGSVNKIVLGKKSRNYSILDGAKTYSELIKNRFFKGAKLLPFPNRINNGQYIFEGKSYQLPVKTGRHAIHGFIYDKTLGVTKEMINDNQASLELEYVYDATITGYPFKFQALLTYCLMRDHGFQYKTKIINLNPYPMPVGDGWHPYFRTGGKVDRMYIKIPAESKLEADAGMIPTGKFIHENYADSFQIGNQELSAGFVLKQANGNAVTELYDPEADVKICIWQETGKQRYNYLQTFIPPSRKSIAIEPMTCAADAFNNKMGLIVLEPQQSFEASCGVYLE